MRTRVWAITVLLVLGGCGAHPAAGRGDVPAPPPTQLKPTRWPAALAGGACQLLDYQVVEETLGLTFDVAAGGRHEATHTCVLQKTGTTVPDLSLSVSPTTATPVVFRSAVAPKGAATVTGLGKAAYRAGVAPVPKSARGAGVEIGWLSGKNRILVLRCTLAPDAPPGAVAQITAKLVELAVRVEQVKS